MKLEAGATGLLLIVECELPYLKMLILTEIKGTLKPDLLVCPLKRMSAAHFFGRIQARVMGKPITHIIGRIIQMIRFNRFNQRAALGALLLCFSLNSAADDIQDANKLFKRGQQAQALNKVNTILTSHPKDAQARFLKALILTEQGQTEESIRMFTALTVDYPELPEPYNNLAVIYAGQGQYEKAKKSLEAALRTHPSYSTAHENLGDIYAKMASQAYDRALQLDRSNANSQTKLALIKEMNSSAIKSAATKIQVAGLNNTPTVTPPQLQPPPATATPAVTTVVSAATASTHIISSAPVITSAALAPSLPVTLEAAKSASNSEVLKAVQDWTKAWSSGNANQYLAMYAKDFKTPNNETRSDWEKQRRERLDKPQSIVVSISNAKVTLQDDRHATVSFIQSYSSGALKATTRKTLELIRNNGIWQIRLERAGA